MNTDVQWIIDQLVKMPDREVKKGWFVTSKTRRLIMTGNLQNTICRKGRVVEIYWENVSGGVYRAYLEVTNG